MASVEVVLKVLKQHLQVARPDFAFAREESSEYKSAFQEGFNSALAGVEALVRWIQDPRPISNCAVFAIDRPEVPLGENGLRDGMTILTPLGAATVGLDAWGSPQAENQHSIIYLDWDDEIRQWVTTGGVNKRALEKLSGQSA